MFDTITLTDELKALHGQIIECAKVDNKWVFKRARDDRKNPNSIKTVVGKLKALDNPVSKRDLLNHLSIKHNKELEKKIVALEKEVAILKKKNLLLQDRLPALLARIEDMNVI